jgi:hypothetical protein
MSTSVLEFDEFLKIEGCKKRKRHLFVGQPKDATAEEKLDTVRHDFYQTPSTVIVSMYLKKIDKSKATVDFAGEREVKLDLPTSDGKRYEALVPLFGSIDTEKSTFKVMGTKLEMTLAKKDGASWPVLRSDERTTGEILQIGRAARA